MSLREDVERCSAGLEKVLSRLQRVQKSDKNGWFACCPAHHDRHPSLSIGIGAEGRILLKCHAGCTVDSIVAVIGLTLADLFPANASLPPRRAGAGITLLDLAAHVYLPWKFLFNLGLSDERGGGVRVPYYLQDGTPAPRYRIRTALVAREGSLWNKGEGEIVPYGLERLGEARKMGALILTEGESDAWTLWFHKWPALGIPGAEMTRTLKPDYLEGIERLYVIQEPDAAGAGFVRQIAARLEAWQWSGKAFAVRLPDAKDPNELHKRDWKAFPQAFQRALDNAESIWQPTVPAAATPPAMPAQNGSSLVSLETLLGEQIATPRWVVRDLLPEGLILLGGKPKQGKSWFCLALALAIATGGRVLDRYQAEQGGVLSLSLEDTKPRLQERLKQLLSASAAAIPADIEFALDWPRLDQGGLAQVEEYIQAHPGLRAVIVDTWAMLAPHTKSGGRSQYEGEYSALSPLKRLADTYHLAIVLVHHLRKAGAKDILDEITGSTGIVGTVDTILVLKRERGQEQATLYVTGRDIPQERFLPLRFDAASGYWHLDASGEEG
jgi:hypothetical protein